MPLVHITGVTLRDTTYDIGYAFVPNEEVQTYNEVIRMLAELFDWLQVVPKCFITDHDKPLKAALTSIFPDTPQRRCIWHINQNVQAKSVKVWDLNKARTVPEKELMNTARLDFIQHWQQLVNCKTADSFWVQWDIIKDEYKGHPELIDYLDEHQVKYHAEWAEYTCQYLPDFGQQAAQNEVQLVIKPTDVHQNWWFRPPWATSQEIQDERYILDPARVKAKGRPTGSTTVTIPLSQPVRDSQAIRGRAIHHQRRDPSGWEYVQATQEGAQPSPTPEAPTADLRRGGRQRRPTQKALEMMETSPNSTAGDELEEEEVVEEVQQTQTRRTFTRKVPSTAQNSSI
ncbi:hypothetical protein P3342_004343 [Pyrenophora teres f. teres]|nr:hypothetical protein P3342_004343 [Pyrenophora teres f. teres]